MATNTCPSCEPKATNRSTLYYITSATKRPSCGARYALAGALLGIASNREKLAETAFLQYPTKDNPNHYHIYQGTQCSHAITQEDIPSWWVLLALVLREEENEGGPNLQVSKRAKQNKPHRAKRGTQLAKNTSKRRVKKTISKRQSTPRSQHNHASQRRQALQAITQAAAEGHPHHPAPSTSTPSRTNATKASITKQTTLPTPPRTTHMGHTTAPNKTTTPPKTPRYEEPDQQVAEYHAQQPTGNPNPPEHQAGDKRRVPPAPPTDLTSIGRQRGTLGLAGPRSIYFYTFHPTLHYLQSQLPQHHVLYVLENATSMQTEYWQAIQLAVGNPRS